MDDCRTVPRPKCTGIVEQRHASRQMAIPQSVFAFIGTFHLMFAASPAIKHVIYLLSQFLIELRRGAMPLPEQRDIARCAVSLRTKATQSHVDCVSLRRELGRSAAVVAKLNERGSIDTCSV